MPDIYFDVEEIGTRYIDPISRQIIRSVITKLGCWDYFALGIYLNNQRMAVSVDDDGSGNIRMGNNRCDVDLTTHYNPTTQMWNRTSAYNATAYGTSWMWRKNKEAVFEDPLIGARLTEFTVPFGLEFNFRLSFKSYDAAQKALGRIYAFTDGDIVNQVHDFVYSYPVSLSLMAGFQQIYKARTSLNKNYTFYQYMNEMSKAQFGFDVRRYDIGKDKPNFEYRVKKQQLGCLALMQCDQDAPEPIMQDSVSDAWAINFSYKVQAGRPNLLQLTLPILVEQNPMPYVFFTNTEKSWCSDIVGAMQDASYDRTLRRFSDYRNGDVMLLRLPQYDDWVVPSDSGAKYYKYNPLVIGVVPITPGDTTTVDLTALDGVQLSNITKEILGEQSADDTLGYGALFNVTVYSNNLPVDRSLVDFDPQTLTVSFKVSRVTNIYRVVLSEATTVRLLQPKWLDYVLKYRYYFPMTIMRSLAYLTQQGYYTVQSDSSFLRLIRRLQAADAITGILQWMIEQGYTSGFVYQFTQTATQLADYLSNTRAVLNKDKVNEDDLYSKTLFDVFIERCVALNYVDPNNLPQKYLLTPRGYPHGPEQGGMAEFNLPLRVMNIKIK